MSAALAAAVGRALGRDLVLRPVTGGSICDAFRGGDDVFVNIAGGLEIDEPAADLGVVAAIASSFKNATIDPHTAVFGEVGLTGEVRGALQAPVRAREAQTLGFKKIIMPASNTAGLERLLGLRVVGVRSVEEALDELF